MSLTLTISHSVFLDKKQRYDLVGGQSQELIGVNIPVWHYQGKTSEPASEIFCKYKLIPTEHDIHVRSVDMVYEIQLPQKTFNPIDNKKNPITIKNILDIKDGGIQWLAFRQFGKIKRKGKRSINVVHFVEIKTIEELIQSLN